MFFKMILWNYYLITHSIKTNTNNNDLQSTNYLDKKFLSINKLKYFFIICEFPWLNDFLEMSFLWHLIDYTENS